MSEYIYERPEQPAKVVRDGWNVRIEWDFKQREEIIRCRDCKHFNEYHGKCHRQSGVLIDDYSTRRFEDLGDVLVLADAEPDGFCKWGVRKENHAG